MCAASQLPGRWPTDFNDAPAPACNQRSDYDDLINPMNPLWIGH